MVLTCSGPRKHKLPCNCLRFLARDNKGTATGLKGCRDCGHVEECHPSPQTTSGLRRNKKEVQTVTPAQNRTPVVARQKINPGHTVKKTGTEPNVKKEIVHDVSPHIASHKRNNHPAMKFVKVGAVIMLPDGLNSEGELVQSKSPSPKQIEKYVQSHLAVECDGDKVLEFGLGWDQESLDIWFRRLLPRPFEWLDAQFGQPDAGKFHWVLLRKDRNNLFVIERALTTGAHVSAAKGTTGRKYTDHFVRIATRHVIPLSAYSNWDAATERVLNEETEAEKTSNNPGHGKNRCFDSDSDASYKTKGMSLELESEAESVIFTSSRKPVTYGGKRSVAVEKLTDSEIEVISDDDDIQITGSTTKARKRNGSSKTNSSDDLKDVQAKRQKVVTRLSLSPSPTGDTYLSWSDLGTVNYPESLTDWDTFEGGLFDDNLGITPIPSTPPSNVTTGPGGPFQAPAHLLDIEASVVPSTTSLLSSQTVEPDRSGFNIPAKPRHNPWA